MDESITRQVEISPSDGRERKVTLLLDNVFNEYSPNFDFSLILFILATCAVFVHYLAAGIHEMDQYFIFFAISLATLPKSKDSYAPFARTRFERIGKIVLITFSSLAAGLTAIIAIVSRGASLRVLEDTMLVATAEQMFFAQTVPLLYMRLMNWGFSFKIPFLKNARRIYLGSYAFALLVSVGAFALAHILRYRGKALLGTFFLGLFLHSIGFFLPGVSISIHFSVNVLALSG